MVDIPEEGEKKIAEKTPSWSLQTMMKTMQFLWPESDVTFADVNYAHIERTLLGDKPHGFESLQSLHNMLIPLEYFTSTEPNREVFEEICRDMRSKLVREISSQLLHSCDSVILFIRLSWKSCDSISSL